MVAAFKVPRSTRTVADVGGMTSRRVGAKLARLLGVDADEVVVADSTSVNLFKLLVAATRLRPDRGVILTESSNFPTDIYVARGVARLNESVELKIVPSGDFMEAIDNSVVVALLTHVNYKTGQMHDLRLVSQKVHEVGGLVLADLSHSAGALPLHLHDCDIDLAVGCGYKYLNGGPGAPAFMYVARRHHAALDQHISAWMGHARPFDFSVEYLPAEDISRLLSGTPPILSIASWRLLSTSGIKWTCLLCERKVKRCRSSSSECSRAIWTVRTSDWHHHATRPCEGATSASGTRTDMR